MRRMIMAVVFVLVLTSSRTLAQDAQTGTSPGLQPYTPSKIEWLALELNAYHRTGALGKDGYSITYIAVGADTITILVQYIEGVDREAMNVTVEAAREVADIVCKSHKWNWVKTKEQYKKYERKR
jgi:hypothetical protein